MGKNNFKGTKIFFYYKWAALLSYEEKQKRKKCVIFWANKSFYISSFSPFILGFLVFFVTLLVALSEFRGKFWCRTFLWKNGKRIEFTLVTLISLPFGRVFSWILVGKMCWKRRLWFLQNWAQYKDSCDFYEAFNVKFKETFTVISIFHQSPFFYLLCFSFYPFNSSSWWFPFTKKKSSI